MGRIYGTLIAFLFAWCGNAIAQEKKPKLVVGIVIDQMRQEYLYRFAPNFGEDGFKRLMGEGYMFSNTHINYVPTATGPGHASIYTGTTPAYHGIVSNNWYDRTLKEKVYCVEDKRFHTVGSKTDAGKASPNRLLTTTITDELKLASNFKSKVIALSIKDRASVLPGGHNPNGAFWYDFNTGDFVTSTYYMEALPGWVEKFNKKDLPDKFLKKTWNRLLPKEAYTVSDTHHSKYENGLNANDKFPYDLQKLSEGKRGKDRYGIIPSTPFGNTILTELVFSAVKSEKLGQGKETDFLAVSYSSPDIIGHRYGPRSEEIEDTYVRLDGLISDLLAFLDEHIGKSEYTVFLTADHAATANPEFLKDNKFPGGYFNGKEAKEQINDALSEKFGMGLWVESMDFMQVYLDRALLKREKVNIEEASEAVKEALMANEMVSRAYTGNTVYKADYNEGGIKGFMVRGYMPQRCGDVIFAQKPGYIQWFNKKGTTHGSPYTYDTNIPMLWFGANVPHGSSSKYHPVTDIAATLSIMLQTKFPSGCTGQPIQEILGDDDKD
ncbi:alkaline phosphatase family protein [Fulvitalea axinellae]|uniref:Alkaline phosphatase family protein n=1 Tax=Fulvitalea axinellae TaxID=1182444 RepID=A0AAU9CL27_9BACT|nr:alkaline phosphatase family protein [Fulvitalea axinellae]